MVTDSLGPTRHPIRTPISIALVFAAGLLALVLPGSATAAPIARTTSLISQPTGVPDPNTFGASYDDVSADGSRVFFETTQSLTSDDGDGGFIDVYERSGGTTKLVSKPTGVADPNTSDAVYDGISADGSRVFFETTQKLTTDDGDTNRTDVYERSGGTTKLVSGPTGVADPNTSDAVYDGISADGSRVFFETTQKLTTDDGDTGLEDVYERSAGTTKLVSGATAIADPNSGSVIFGGASADGSRVFFETGQKLTADDGDTNRNDVYEHSGGVTRLDSGPTGVADPDSGNAVFGGASADGSRVFFETTQKLTTDDGDTNRNDVYERSGGTTKLVSGPTGVADPDTTDADFQRASADGSRVFFETTQKLTADDGDTNRTDVYERSGGTTKLVSGPTGVADPDSADANFRGASTDGSHVFFVTTQKLTGDDGDSNLRDVYERSGGATALVSGPTGVADPNTSDAGSFQGASADGSRVFFATTQKLTGDDGDSNRRDVYERSGGATTLVSGPTGVADPNSDDAFFDGVSADGRRVIFETTQKLTPDDGDSGFGDVYMAADTTAPQTTITGGPSGTTGDATPSFSFVSSEAGSSFECRVDSGAFVSCSSPRTVAALADGAHTFQVRARDNVGNLDTSAASRGFTVDTTLPGGGGGGLVPTAAQIKAALGGDLKAAARALRKLGIRELRKRRGANVKNVDALRAGTVRMTGVAEHVTVLSGKRKFTKAGKGTLKLKLTRKGRTLLRRSRRLRITLRASFTDANGTKTKAKARKVTIKRRP